MLHTSSQNRVVIAGALLLFLMTGGLAATPPAGVYSGTTGQGKSISITVSGGIITSFSTGWTCGGSSGTTTVNTSCPIGVGDSFSCGSSSCSSTPFSLNPRITGSFSGGSVSGTLDFSFRPCISGCTCCVGSGIAFSGSLPMPAISINDISVVEGDSGTTTAQFDVTRTYDSGENATVSWATSDGSADATDYAAASGVLTFGPGELSKPVSVTIFGDLDEEPDEIFHVDLSNPLNAILADDQGQCTITDDDTVLPSPVTTVFSISGFESVDGFGDADNDVLTKYLGAGALVTGIGWDVNISTVGMSWLSDAKMYFDGSDQDGSGLVLRPGAGDDHSGTGAYSSPLIDLTDNGIPDIPILADGTLYIRFYEDFDDDPGGVDASYVPPSTLTIEYLPGSDRIFADGFESGDVTAWSSTVPAAITSPPDPSRLAETPQGGASCEASSILSVDVGAHR